VKEPAQEARNPDFELNRGGNASTARLPCRKAASDSKPRLLERHGSGITGSVPGYHAEWYPGRDRRYYEKDRFFNLQFDRPPTLGIWGSDTYTPHPPDMLYDRTCHRCTSHRRERPWEETQGPIHNRDIELCLSFLNLFGGAIEAPRLSVDVLLPALAVILHFHAAGSCSRNLWLFRFVSSVNGVRVVAFEQLLDSLDRALQVVDQVFIANGEQIGKESADLRPDFSIFLATSLHFN